ncbi:hypothetical protein ICY_02468 [Bacillus cereus BAG2X1-3]|nr:hypothetical protein ICY_02468 [Bacillus cereus BAG2X1-3]
MFNFSAALVKCNSFETAKKYSSWRKTFEKRMRGEEISTKERIEGKKE